MNQARIKTRFVKGYDALARTLLAHDEFPKIDRPANPRSLGNRLRDLDRGSATAVAWLEQRPGARRALLEVLDWNEAQLERVLHPVGDGPMEGVVDLDDVELQRPVDLRRDSLFPGIPETALAYRTWSRHWWVAPAGSGRTLAGRWLEAQGLATFVRPRDADELADALPASGAVYVDLERAAPGTERSLARLPAALRVLVAAPFAPGQGWTLVHSDGPEVWAPALLNWVAQWIDGRGAFSPGAARDVLERGPWRDLCTTPGATLALAGLLDQLGKDRLLAASPGELIDLWLTGALGRSDRADAPAWLHAGAWPLLQSLARGLLTGSEGSWSDSRPLEEWAALIHDPGSATPDVAGALGLLSSSADGLSSEDVKRLRGHLESTAQGRIQGLVAARLLEPAGGGRYDLRPAWAVYLACQSVTEELLSAGPLRWGEAALRSPWSELVVRHLWGRYREGDLRVGAAAVEALDPDDLASVAALEAAFRAAGLACAEGACVEQAHVEQLWQAQARVAVRPFVSSDHARPRIDHGGWGVRAELLSEGVWILAATAMAERLEAPLSSALGPRLDPWRTPESLEQATEELAWVPLPSRYVGRPPEDPAEFDWSKGAYRVGARLLARCGPLIRLDDVIDLQGPAYVASAAAEGDDLAKALRFVGTTVGAFDAIEAAAEELGVGFEEVVCPALWRADAERGTDAMLVRMLRDGRYPDAERWWARVPPELLRGPLARVCQWGWIPWPLLDGPRMRAAVDAMIQDPDVFEHHVPPASMPDDALAYAIENCPDVRLRDDTLLRAAWSRLPHISLEAATQRLESGDPDAAAALLTRAPDGIPIPGLDSLEEWASSEPTHDESLRVRGFLRRRIGTRAPGWRRAYALYARLEAARTS